MRGKERLMGMAGEKKEPSRLLALSDGLFATVLTLLVLDLRPPDTMNNMGGTIHGFISWVGPRLFAYLLTFLVSGNYWISHHRDFTQIVGNDRGLMGYNLIFLLFIGLLPFSTAALSAASNASKSYSFYWAIYSGNLIFAGVMLGLTREYAVRHSLIKPVPNLEYINYIRIRHIVTPTIFAISIAFQYIFQRRLMGPYVLLLIPAALWVVDHFLSPSSQDRREEALFHRFIWGAGRIIPWLIVLALSILAMNT